MGKITQIKKGGKMLKKPIRVYLDKGGDYN